MPRKIISVFLGFPLAMSAEERSLCCALLLELLLDESQNGRKRPLGEHLIEERFDTGVGHHDVAICADHAAEVHRVAWHDRLGVQALHLSATQSRPLAHPLLGGCMTLVVMLPCLTRLAEDALGQDHPRAVASSCRDPDATCITFGCTPESLFD